MTYDIYTFDKHFINKTEQNIRLEKQNIVDTWFIKLILYLI